ncbi:hypothetical protein [Luteimonas qiangzhengi]
MNATSLESILRWTGKVVLLLMVMAAVYAGYTAISYWPEIRV